ncbi:MAG: tetratricopeptide repeat protein [Sulfuritalea sp.]|nr:tetratricopeptide repeat protein [Sulfuritalea sp.]
MSLVNKMLRDLDARRAGEGERAVLPAAVTPLAARQEPFRISPLIWLAVVLAIVVLGVLAFLAFQGDVPDATAPVIVAAAPTPAPAPMAATAPLTTAPVAAPEAGVGSEPLDPSAPATEPHSNFATLQMADQLTGLQAPVPAPASAPVPAAEPPAKVTPRASAPPAAKALPIVAPKPVERSAASEVVPQPVAVSAAPKVAAVAPAPTSKTPKTSKETKPSKEPKIVEQKPVSVPKPPVVKAPAKTSIDKTPRLSTPMERAEQKYRQGVQVQRQGDLESASTSYRAALEDYPEHAAARQALSALLIDSRRFDEAEDLLRMGVELPSVRLPSTLAWARLKVERKQAPAALELLQKYAASGERSADYQGFFGALLNRAGRAAEAVEHYKAATQLAPDEGRWWAGLGIALDSAGRGQEAREAYRKARTMPGLPADLAQHIDRRLH